MEIVDYKCVYFTFGRFQPPTVGHAENLKQYQRQQDAVIGLYISHKL